MTVTEMFAYVVRNPINFLDPFGLEKWGKHDSWHEVFGDISYIASLLKVTPVSLISKILYNVTYTYDAENNRIGMVTPKKQVRYVVDSQQELTRILRANETDAKTNELKVTYYIYGRGLIAQEQITVEDGYTSTKEEHTGLFGKVKYKTGGYRIYHFDHLGNTTAVTNEDGSVVNSYDYSPYGQIIAGQEGAYLFLYNGQYGVTTDGNGLYHMRARYYNVSIMRFINQDVVHGNLSDSQSLNRFAYVEGNPINFLDPFGLEKWRSAYYLEHELFDEWNKILMEYNISLLGANVLNYIFEAEIGEAIAFLLAIINVVEVFSSTMNMIYYLDDIFDAFFNGTEEDLTWALDGFEDSFLSTTIGIVGLGNASDVITNYDEVADNIFGGMDFVQTLHSKTDVLALSRHEMNRDISEILMENREAIIERIFRYDE